jgi:ATP-dependent phosphofructokinase / diphosphate-dependent phosphofructokinase
VEICIIFAREFSRTLFTLNHSPMADIKRIIVGQSGGPTPVIDWTVDGILTSARDKGIEVYGAKNGLEGILHADIEGNIVDLSGIDPTQFIYNGPGSGLGATRVKPKPEQLRKIAENLDKLKVDAIVYIGGNDSSDQLKSLADVSGIKAIHAIKTVDNDLPVTHHSPGFGSAALYNAIALKNVVSDFSSYKMRGRLADGRMGVLHAPVVIYQVMGRKAGWLAQATAFARVDQRGVMVPGRAPHMILSKEILFEKDKFLSDAADTISKYGEAVIVVQEDLTEKNSGKSIAEVYGEVTRDPHGNIQHGRAGSFQPGLFLARIIQQELKVDGVAAIKEAVLVPQHIQRSYCMSQTDASEAYMIGYGAVEALLAGETRKSVVLVKEGNGNFRTGLTDLENIARKETNVDMADILGNFGPTQSFVDEYLHCIGGALAIPHYSHMVYKHVKF